MASPTPSPRERLAFALDVPDEAHAREIATLVAPHVGVLKVGLELFVRSGPSATRIAHELGCRSFLDLKLHDIPETVERAVANACQLGVSLLTVHATGGPRMLERALTRASSEATGLTILAVTVLTSLDADDLMRVGVAGGPANQVERLAKLAWSVGIRSFVCSPTDALRLRTELGPDAYLVTPGIRPAAGTDDQKRVGTPEEAIRAGASLLVVGRPIRDAQDPAAAAAGIQRQIRLACGA